MSIVPDEITPRSAWRAWSFDGTHILSMRGDVWKPGEAMEASCPHTDFISQPLQSVGTMSVLTIPQTEEQIRDGRKTWLASHGEPNALVSSYDVDKGERYVPFGKISRLWIPNVVSDEKPTAPGERCSCGIYSTNSLDTARHYVTNAPGHPSPADPLGNHGVGILGRVALWGRVVVHADGYRAQYAYPQSFFTDDQSVREALAKYNVPILSTKELPQSDDAASRMTPASQTVWNRMVAQQGMISAAQAATMVGAPGPVPGQMPAFSSGWMSPYKSPPPNASRETSSALAFAVGAFICGSVGLLLLLLTR